MQALMFEVRAPVASFRDPFFHTYHRSLPFPPKTTLVGLIGAALGYSAKQVNDELLGRLRIAQRRMQDDSNKTNFTGKAMDLWRIRKVVTGNEKKAQTKPESVVYQGNVYYPAPIMREWIVGVCLRVFVAGDDHDLLTEIAKHLEHPFYALSLGRDDDLCKIDGIQNVVLQEKSELIFNDVMLSFDWRQRMIPAVDQYKGGMKLSPQTAELPTRFHYAKENVRLGVDNRTFSFLISFPVRDRENRVYYADPVDGFGLDFI